MLVLCSARKLASSSCLGVSNVGSGSTDAQNVPSMHRSGNLGEGRVDVGVGVNFYIRKTYLSQKKPLVLTAGLKRGSCCGTGGGGFFCIAVCALLPFCGGGGGGGAWGVARGGGGGGGGACGAPRLGGGGGGSGGGGNGRGCTSGNASTASTWRIPLRTRSTCLSISWLCSCAISKSTRTTPAFMHAVTTRRRCVCSFVVKSTSNANASSTSSTSTASSPSSAWFLQCAYHDCDTWRRNAYSKPTHTWNKSKNASSRCSPKYKCSGASTNCVPILVSTPGAPSSSRASTTCVYPLSPPRVMARSISVAKRLRSGSRASSCAASTTAVLATVHPSTHAVRPSLHDTRLCTQAMAASKRRRRSGCGSVVSSNASCNAVIICCWGVTH